MSSNVKKKSDTWLHTFTRLHFYSSSHWPDWRKTCKKRCACATDVCTSNNSLCSSDLFSVTAHSPNLWEIVFSLQISYNISVYIGKSVTVLISLITGFQDWTVAKKDTNLFENTFCKSRTGDRWSLLNVKTLQSFYTEAPTVRVLQGFREVQFSPDKAPTDAHVSNFSLMTLDKSRIRSKMTANHLPDLLQTSTARLTPDPTATL